MLVVDASVLFEIVADTPESEPLRERLSDDPDHAAPHLIDAEILSVIQTQHRLGRLDPTAASQAVDDVRAWPGERWSHRPLLERAWDLRANVRAYDALYLALAEALDATLVTLDRRLAAAQGLECAVEIPGHEREQSANGYPSVGTGRRWATSTESAVHDEVRVGELRRFVLDPERLDASAYELVGVGLLGVLELGPGATLHHVGDSTALD